MIDLNHWMAFAIASLLIAALPGPGVANIVGFAVSSGRATALAAVAGAVTGNVVAMTLSLAGVGALMLAFPRAFRSIELAGAAYLIALGVVGVIRSKEHAPATPRTRIAPHAAYAASVAVSALNPKSMIFFIAFVPQFIRPDPNYVAQCFVLVATFAAIVAASDTLYALLALRVLEMLRAPKTLAWVRRGGGVILICTGLFAAMVG